MLQRRDLLTLFAISCLPAVSRAARPRVRIVVPHPAGGPLDFTTRLTADALSARYEKVLVENRPGAGGTSGMRWAAQAKRDTVLVVGSVATLAVNPHLFRELGYDPQKDFQPLRLLASMPNVLVVHPDLAKEHGVADLKAFLEYAGQNPQLPYASGGVGSGAHMAGALLAHEFDLSLLHVPFQGAGPAQHSLLSRRTAFFFDNLQSALSAIRAGSLMPLAVTSRARSPLLPDTPTVEEVTGKAFDIGTWYGFLGNRRLSPEDAALWTERLRTVLADETLRERIASAGAEVSDLEGEAFARFIEDERAKYGELVRLAGIQAS